MSDCKGVLVVDCDGQPRSYPEGTAWAVTENDGLQVYASWGVAAEFSRGTWRRVEQIRPPRVVTTVSGTVGTGGGAGGGGGYASGGSHK